MKRNKRILTMGSKVILLLLSFLLCFTGCQMQDPDTSSQSTSTEAKNNPILDPQPYDRYSGESMQRISYTEIKKISVAYKESPLVVKVEIVAYEGTYRDSCTIFRAKILEEYKNELECHNEEIYIAQLGTIDCFVFNEPLYKLGDIYLLSLQTDSWYEEAVGYPNCFSPINWSYGVLQSHYYQGEEYVVYRKNPIDPYMIELSDQMLDEETTTTVWNDLLEADGFLHYTTGRFAWRYADVISFLKVLEIQ